MSSQRSQSFYQSPRKTSTKLGDGNVVNKVQYFNHFPKDFLRPYGPATEDGATTKEMIHKRLRTINCEWLCRPSMAASELSDSICHNSQVLSSLQIFHRGAKHFAAMDKKLEGVSEGKCSHFHSSFPYLHTIFTSTSALFIHMFVFLNKHASFH